MPAGFSTGCLYKNHDPLSPEAIDLVAQSGARLIELSAVMLERLPDLARIEPRQLAGFEYVGLHAPANLRYRNDAAAHEALRVLSEACERLPVRHVVFHPDTIEAWEVVEAAGLPAAFENMDRFKSFGRTMEDMEKILGAGKNRKMILDVAHAHTNDPSMRLARELLERFRDRIAAIHLSGCRSQKGGREHHVPLSLTLQEELFLPLPAGVPVVIESVWPKTDSREELLNCLKKELRYVEERLQ